MGHPGQFNYLRCLTLKFPTENVIFAIGKLPKVKIIKIEVCIEVNTFNFHHFALLFVEIILSYQYFITRKKFKNIDQITIFLVFINKPIAFIFLVVLYFVYSDKGKK